MNANLILKKLGEMESYLKELETFVLSRKPEEVKKDATLLHTAERLVQLLVDTMIDINIHILLSKEKTYDKTQSTFLLLGEMGVLPEEFAKKIAPIVGFRNILVHRYEVLDKDLFIRNLFKNKADFKQYIVAIHDFIEREKEQRL
jgi:uncharacterized protein YutE (UPF0331/DUF86 family)